MSKELINKFIFQVKRVLIRLLEELGHKYCYVSIFDYVLEHPDKAQLLSMKVEKTVYTEAINYDSNEKRDSYHPDLRLGIDLFDWLAVIKDVKCFADTDLVITSDGHAIYDIKDYKSISQYGEYTYGPILHDNQTYCQLHRMKVTHIDEAFLLDGLWSWNWYHFVVQVLPKIKYISQIPDDVPILVGPHLKNDNNFRAMLEIFLNQYSSKREIVYMQNRHAYEVKNLHLASAQGLLIPDIKNSVQGGARAEWCLYKQSTISFLCDTMLKEKHAKIDYPKKIYISRRNASNRRRFNEDEVIALMQQLGFAIVAPEEYSVCEQAQLFNHADCIVACSGAALTNLLYCKSSSKIVILGNYKQKVGVFNTIAALNGAECLNVNGYEYEMKGDKSQDPFIIDMHVLNLAMKQLGMI
jgi:Capsular polysaccharide biosynthesis protein